MPNEKVPLIKVFSRKICSHFSIVKWIHPALHKTHLLPSNIFAILLSISSYALSRPRSNLDTIWPLNSLFKPLQSENSAFLIQTSRLDRLNRLVMAKKIESSFLSVCWTNSEKDFNVTFKRRWYYLLFSWKRKSIEIRRLFQNLFDQIVKTLHMHSIVIRDDVAFRINDELISSVCMFVSYS